MLLFAAKPFTRDALYPELGVTRHFCVEALQLCMVTGPEARLRQRAAALVVVWLQMHDASTKKKIKGLDNPTCQLPPIMSNKCCSGTGKDRGRKDKGGGEGSRSKNSCVGQSCM